MKMDGGGRWRCNAESVKTWKKLLSVEVLPGRPRQFLRASAGWVSLHRMPRFPETWGSRLLLADS